MKSLNFILTGLMVIIIVGALVALCVDTANAEELGEPTIKAWTDADAEIIAKTVWGEARGCSVAQKSAVVWCVLNRVDSEWFSDTIDGVVTEPGQFFGYSETNPVDPVILEIVTDALIWWAVEDVMPSEYRVLPAEYLYFFGNGEENVYTTENMGGLAIKP